MREVARIVLPDHRSEGGFDHAAVDPRTDRLYVAHPSNDAVEVVDLRERRSVRSVPGLRGVAGVLVAEADRFLFTSNRGEDSVSVFRLDEEGERELLRVRTGSRPNGLAFDPRQKTLLVAGVGDPQREGCPPTVTLVNVDSGRVEATFDVPGRTRWALYHPPSDAFYVNVAEPASILRVPANSPVASRTSFSIPARGPHGLEQDPDGSALYCACDDGTLLRCDPRSGAAEEIARLSGPPDVLWIDPVLRRLYAAIGTTGCVDAFDLRPFRARAPVSTGPGSHTLTVDHRRHELHVFLPGSHEDLVLQDGT